MIGGGLFVLPGMAAAKTGTGSSIWLAYLVVLFLRLGNRLYARKLAWTCIALFLVALVSIWPIDASRGGSKEITGNLPSKSLDE